MNRHEIRYMLEHRFIPKWFFEDKGKFIGTVLHEQGILFEVIDDLFQKEGVENPYSAEDFKVMAAKITDDVLLLRIGFPEPEEEPLCYCAYLFFDADYQKLGYYCIEKGNAESGDLPFVCSWTPDEVHHNYGNCTMEGHDDLRRCMDVHMELMYNMKREDQ